MTASQKPEGGLESGGIQWDLVRSDGEENIQEHCPACSFSRVCPWERLASSPAPRPMLLNWPLALKSGAFSQGGYESTAGQAPCQRQEKSKPNLCSLVVSSDEGLWDMFVKDIPRSATSYSVSLDKLRQGVTYEFRVVAVNQAGYGEPSSPSMAVSGREPCPRKELSGRSSSLSGGRG